MTNKELSGIDRRTLFARIGKAAGAAVMYQAMASLAYAQESGFSGTPQLSGGSKGTKVLVLGAGLAGMVAALELRNAGYEVEILEYNNRAGGRNWTLRGGSSYTELGGFRQDIDFSDGVYFNAGPWRIPYHHRGILHYCKMLGVQMEPFVQINYNAYVHSSNVYDGKPRRYREVEADFQGHIAELLSKSMRQDDLDMPVTVEDREQLLEALRSWGALDGDFRYVKGSRSAGRRGYDTFPGGGLHNYPPQPGEPMTLDEILRGEFWEAINQGHILDDQQTLFQPVGGMGKIGEAFGKKLDGVIRYNAKVTDIRQDDNGVVATYVDSQAGGPPQTSRGDWCVCTIPLSVLSQIPMNVSGEMIAAINAMPYAASAKVGLQMRRRFWEEDEGIYGGISYTNLPNRLIAYPSNGMFDSGPALLLASYSFGNDAAQHTALAPDERIAMALEYGSQVHPQMREEFQTGASVAWHRMPSTLGCFAVWRGDSRERHYRNLCAIDGRIVLAGEHASMIPAWQEGAVLSGLDAISRLHQRILAS